MLIILLLFGVVLIALLAYYKKKLTFSGAITAVVVGSLISIGLGLFGLLLLGAFFFSSMIIGSIASSKKDLGIVDKGQRRDATQVLANGGVSAIIAIVYFIFPSELFICGFVASLAAANSDTWASEIGVHSKQLPLHLIEWTRVPPGTSGAITILGSIAAFAGSLFIVIFSIFLWSGTFSSIYVSLIILTLAGFLGNLFDTVLGGVWQVVYRCSQCSIETERRFHCNKKTIQIKGKSWMNNDFVNFGCTSFGAIIGILAAWLFL
ncbi:DUF92 domain-containing protein [Alkalihalobacillus sp. MEB130]|uniref:DUF92 domain-containing protein n=1 Tax=Alkalihalobacillus sp. MEB130 TaxID=2976704 RepID=UPI0028DD7B43|nr:DUF92 domain-containing protein [Alkalihalobacillus sp. MEB130]MDT8861730.1 DUF92 domain-containing protein [Alkalihalobacillus sp. MEB130]